MSAEDRRGNDGPPEETHERQATDIVTAREVWVRHDLTPFDKFLYAEIRSLSKGPQGCFASNRYLAKFCDCTDRHIRRTIDRLEKAKLLSVSYEFNPKFYGGCRRTMKTLRPWDQEPEWCDRPLFDTSDTEGRTCMSGGDSEGGVRTLESGGGGHESPTPPDIHVQQSSTAFKSEGKAVNRVASSHARACEDGFNGKKRAAPVAVEEDPAVNRSVALLMTPEEDGGAGFTRHEGAQRVAALRCEEELRHWIKLAKDRKVDSISRFMYACITRGDAPPESYLKAQKKAAAPKRLPEGVENAQAYVTADDDGYNPNHWMTREEQAAARAERKARAEAAKR
jgi:hypothetical protein